MQPKNLLHYTLSIVLPYVTVCSRFDYNQFSKAWFQSIEDSSKLVAIDFSCAKRIGSVQRSFIDRPQPKE